MSGRKLGRCRDLRGWDQTRLGRLEPNSKRIPKRQLALIGLAFLEQRQVELNVLAANDRS
jgi:hypothetical protein